MPGLSAAKISGCGSGARFASPGVWSRSSRKCCPGDSATLPLGERADPEFRSLQVGHDADRPADLALERADRVEARLVVLMGAVAEIEPEHVDAGPNSAAIISAVELAGPSVATILAARWRLTRHGASSTRMARKSFTLVRVGPVTTRSPRAANAP